ncbi:MAG: glycosyl transferase, UDP-glucuronosyltransferase [Bacteroidales bacterium]|nr:glycosyl transferase, UDP-glucuronosyltransferase [Bacteroidales bacterium]
MSNILFASIPLNGHIAPMLTIAEELVKNGHIVKWYSSNRFEEPITRTGASFIGLKHAFDLTDELDLCFPERMKMKGVKKAKYDTIKLCIEPIPLIIQDIEEVLLTFNADIIIADNFFWSALVLKKKRQIPVVLIGISIFIMTSKDTAPQGTGLYPNNTLLGKIRNTLLNFIFKKIASVDLQIYYNRILTEKCKLPKLETHFTNLPEMCDLYLQCTIPSFEYPRSDLSKNVKFIGSKFQNYPKEFNLPKWWNCIKNTKKPIVHVTQGTLSLNLDDLIIPTCKALEGENVIVIASCGRKEMDSLIRESFKPNIFIESFIPYELLFEHIDILITNGGYGTVNIAMRYGVPVIVAGETEEKPEIAVRVEWSGLGINLKTSRPSTKDIKGAVEEILNNNSYRFKAIELSNEYKKYNTSELANNYISEILNCK